MFVLPRCDDNRFDRQVFGLGRKEGCGFGDNIFNTEIDVISDVNKLHRFGFEERMDSSASLTAALDSLQRKRLLP